jgi:hypothetical protein
MDLPSRRGLVFSDMHLDLNGYNREIIYMLWQTQHRQNTVNGVNGYYPPSRLRIDRLGARLPEPQAIRLLYDVGVRYLVYHPRMVVRPADDILEALRTSPLLAERVETDRIVIFEISPLEAL